MPIYEYRCESCSRKFEVLTRFAERDTAQICPACESTRTRVLVSSFAVTGGEPSAAADFGTDQGGGGCCGGACRCSGSRPDPPSNVLLPGPCRGTTPRPPHAGRR